MTTLQPSPSSSVTPTDDDRRPPDGSSTHGRLGRLGAWTADHPRIVFGVWITIVIGLGIMAPRVEHTLSGAGWEATGSESVTARATVDEQIGGRSSSALMVTVVAPAGLDSPESERAIERATSILEKDDRVSQVDAPRPGLSRSADGTTAILLAGADGSPTQMVHAADDLTPRLEALSGDGVTVAVTGASGMWSDFNAANRSAMMRSELFSWPVTLAILVVAFGSLVAAGLPLLLTITGLVASAGMLAIVGTVFDVSIWAMNFAMMFALALGIDYALFIVARYRAARFGHGVEVREAVAQSMDTAGLAVLFSGITVLISLSAVLIVPSPAFRSMALGIMIAVAFVLAASLTLLPAVLGALGDHVNRLSLPWVDHGEHRSPRFARWAERLWRRPLAWGALSLLTLIALAVPVVGLDTGMPSIRVVPESAGSRQGFEAVQDSFGRGAPATLQVVVRTTDAPAALATLADDEGIAGAAAAGTSRDGRTTLIMATPSYEPSSDALAKTIADVRRDLPGSALVGGASAENVDLEQALADATPLVVGTVLLLGFLLLLLVVRAPLLAALGSASSLLATVAAFGVARIIFQEGVGTDLMNIESQGFLDAWAPVFFFAMIFAISMDYTVFLLSSAREHFERTGDPRDAMVNGLAHSGPVIIAAAVVMVAVFFTFALTGPLPPREMGIILGVAVLLDAVLVRLLLLPVAMRLAGARAWHVPRWLDRLLPDIRFTH